MLSEVFIDEEDYRIYKLGLHVLTTNAWHPTVRYMTHVDVVNNSIIAHRSHETLHVNLL